MRVPGLALALTPAASESPETVEVVGAVQPVIDIGAATVRKLLPQPQAQSLLHAKCRSEKKERDEKRGDTGPASRAVDRARDSDSQILSEIARNSVRTNERNAFYR